MSDPKIISPLLDGFTLGSPMGDHDGVRCYPALKENSNEKYIVKVISVPASQVQLDALLLTGAYKDPADATEYFKNLAEDVIKEAEFLQKLSKLEGFLSYRDWQVVPMEDGKLGYEVYLVSNYKRSLERYMRRSPMTHLEAINLGLDLCTALAICRRAGSLYVDLKPSNIFISKEKEYRIGDLGFTELASLAYSSLPGKYRSPYAPPEVHNDLNTLNETVDTYAVGMILYQIYNDGNLPAPPLEPKDPFPTPANADYEIAEIILKAVSPIPAQRWKDPMEMGQALVAYMQRNSINNNPISVSNLINPDGVALEQLETEPKEQPSEPKIEPAAEVQAEETQETEVLPAPAASEEAPEVSEEAVPAAAEEAPAEAAEPAKVEAPVAVAEKPQEDEDDAFFRRLLEDDHTEEEEIIEEEPLPEPEPKKRPVRKSRHVRKVLHTITTLLILALVCCSAFLFYQLYYIQTIDGLRIEGSQNSLTVTVDTAMDTSLLSIHCTDTYGNRATRQLEKGKAVFDDLQPDSLYRIELEVSGMHKLVGPTAEIFTTEAMTNVVSMSAIVGPEDGSVKLSFTVDGADPAEWTVTCTAEGEETVTEQFTGHTVTVRGLTVGKLYTFQLSSSDGLDVLGNNTLEYAVSGIVLAQNLRIEAFVGDTITVCWDDPEDAVVESWTVRCYNDKGQEQIQEVTENIVSFTGIDPEAAYTVEVTASGMTQPARTSITQKPITVSNIQVSDEDPEKLTVTWEHEGETPEGGWLLLYTFDNLTTASVVKCEDASGEIPLRIPGAQYNFEIQAVDGTTVFGGRKEFLCPYPDVFFHDGLSANKITAYLLKTPEAEDWTYEDVGEDALTDTFSAGDKISIVLKASDNFYLNKKDLSVLYVFRDGDGNVISELIAQDTAEWKELWYAGDYHIGELDIPTAPDAPGDYSLSLYFDNQAVIYITFSVT